MQRYSDVLRSYDIKPSFTRLMVYQYLKDTNSSTCSFWSEKTFRSSITKSIWKKSRLALSKGLCTW